MSTSVPLWKIAEARRCLSACCEEESAVVPFRLQNILNSLRFLLEAGEADTVLCEKAAAAASSFVEGNMGTRALEEIEDDLTRVEENGPRRELQKERERALERALACELLVLVE